MASLNKKNTFNEKTPGGAVAVRTPNKEMELRRSVMSYLLWESEFYEDGESIASRIEKLIPQVDARKVADIAVEAREQMKLRHIPLFIVRIMAKTPSHKHLVAETLARVIQRPDELTEFLAIYWKGEENKTKKSPLSAQVKKGLAAAFGKFNEYSLAKYSRDGAIKLRDVLFLCHAKPKDATTKFTKIERKDGNEYELNPHEDLYKRLIDGNLATPDTWEVELSAGSVDKKDSWTRMLSENKLGGLALLRNLRNMEEANVDHSLIRKAIINMDSSRVLPFRFIAASQHAPRFEPELDIALINLLKNSPKLPGKTVLVVDISGSMGARLSGKSTMSRMDAAIALSIILEGLCEDIAIYATAGNDWRRIHATGFVPRRSGMALKDAICSMNKTLGMGGIFLTQVCRFIAEKESNIDRLIVITDEADCSASDKDKPSLADPIGKNNYLINVASYKNGVGYGKWNHVDGFSESVVQFIAAMENNQ